LLDCADGAASPEILQFNHVGLEARETPAVGGEVFSLDFPAYRTTGGRRRKKGCPLCRPYRNDQQEIVGYRHHFVLAAVVGGDLTLPMDVEAYGPGDSEYAAGQRLLRRVRANLGARFIDYVVVDGGFATAPFLHSATEAGWPVVARLKDNLPELSRAAEWRFRSRPPNLKFRDGTDRVEIWDADDFDGKPCV
jgi:Transposase DDE domain